MYVETASHDVDGAMGRPVPQQLKVRVVEYMYHLTTEKLSVIK